MESLILSDIDGYLIFKYSRAISDEIIGGEGTIADAILDRIVNSSLRIDLQGESLRKGILKYGKLSAFPTFQQDNNSKSDWNFLVLDVESVT